jgi:hypothetical protein
MTSSLGARVLLLVAGLAATLAYGSWLALRTAFDSNATAGAARSVLATDAVQRDLGDQIADQVDSDLGDRGADSEVRAAVSQALHDPRVVDAFETALHDVHAQLLADNSGKVTVNTAAITGSIRDALAQQNAAAADEFARQAPVSVDIGGDDLPHLGHARDIAEGLVWFGGLAALMFGAASLALAHDRKSVARVGRRIAYLGTGPLLGFVVLPHFSSRASGDVPAVLSALLRTYSSRVVPSAVVVVVLGLAVVAGAYLVPWMRASTQPELAPAPQPPAAPTAVMPRVDEKLYL